MNRRSFFKSVAKAIAIVAIAPEICFKTRLNLPSSQYYLNPDVASFNLDACFKALYEMKHVRESLGAKDRIELFIPAHSERTVEAFARRYGLVKV